MGGHQDVEEPLFELLIKNCIKFDFALFQRLDQDGGVLVSLGVFDLREVHHLVAVLHPKVKQGLAEAKAGAHVLNAGDAQLLRIF